MMKKSERIFPFLMDRKTALAVILFLLAAVAPIVVNGADDNVVIFTDQFDGNGSNLENGWNNFSDPDASKPARKESKQEFIAGLDESKGLLFEGSKSSDPDDGAERAISTRGYADLTVEYSRATAGFGAGDQFVVQYSLDEGAFVELETISSDQEYSKASFNISNPNRNSKLTIRFFLNATGKDIYVGIDNVAVSGANPPQFHDGFESDYFDEGGWTTEGSPRVVKTDKDVWTDNNNDENGHAANIDGSSINNNSGDDDEEGVDEEGIENGDIDEDEEDSDAAQISVFDDLITKQFDASGLENIHIRYARKTSGWKSGDEGGFTASYSVDGGGNWTDLEELNQDEDYASVLFGPLAGADNNADLMIRFAVEGNNASRNAFIDDVIIWGSAIPEEEAPAEEVPEEDDQPDGEESGDNPGDDNLLAFQDELSALIEEAQSILDGATIGSEVGEYPETAADALSAAISAAENVVTSTDLQVLEDAIVTLDVAIAAFNASVNVASDPIPDDSEEIDDGGEENTDENESEEEPIDDIVSDEESDDDTLDSGEEEEEQEDESTDSGDVSDNEDGNGGDGAEGNEISDGEEIDDGDDEEITDENESTIAEIFAATSEIVAIQSGEELVQVIKLLSDILVSTPIAAIEAVPSGAKNTVLLLAGNVISLSSGEDLAVEDLSIESIRSEVLPPVVGSNMSEILQWGIPERELIFSLPITITLYVGEALNGQTLQVFRSTDGNSWTTNGIVPPATCVVSAGLCVFQATKASYYTAMWETSPVGNNGGGGGSSGSSGAVAVSQTLALPANISVLIAGGSDSTGLEYVTLGLSADNATEVMISNESDFKWSFWLPYSRSKSWILIRGEGTKMVYAKFRNSAGGVSETVFDSIIKEAAKPTPILNLILPSAKAAEIIEPPSVAENESTDLPIPIKFETPLSAVVPAERYIENNGLTADISSGLSKNKVGFLDFFGELFRGFIGFFAR